MAKKKLDKTGNFFYYVYNLLFLGSLWAFKFAIKKAILEARNEGL